MRVEWDSGQGEAGAVAGIGLGQGAPRLLFFGGAAWLLPAAAFAQAGPFAPLGHLDADVAAMAQAQVLTQALADLLQLAHHFAVAGGELDLEPARLVADLDVDVAQALRAQADRGLLAALVHLPGQALAQGLAQGLRAVGAQRWPGRPVTPLAAGGVGLQQRGRAVPGAGAGALAVALSASASVTRAGADAAAAAGAGIPRDGVVLAACP
jgi:hypothetical protein